MININTKSVMKAWQYPLLFALSICAMPVFASEDIALGKALYLAPGKGGCVICHGETGNEPVMPMYPNIGGQRELYLFNQLQDYKHKKRKNGLFVPMEVAMQVYSVADIRLIAKYLASIK